jgi:hypothetical protein
MRLTQTRLSVTSWSFFMDLDNQLEVTSTPDNLLFPMIDAQRSGSSSYFLMYFNDIENLMIP